jgi:hypothetical protein
MQLGRLSYFMLKIIFLDLRRTRVKEEEKKELIKIKRKY